MRSLFCLYLYSSSDSGKTYFLVQGLVSTTPLFYYLYIKLKSIMILDNLEIQKDLLNCVKILTQILDERDLTPGENSRVKYVTKTLRSLTNRAQEEADKDFYITCGDFTIGKIIENHEANALLLQLRQPIVGDYRITSVIERGSVVAYDLLPVK